MYRDLGEEVDWAPLPDRHRVAVAVDRRLAVPSPQLDGINTRRLAVTTEGNLVNWCSVPRECQGGGTQSMEYS